MWRPYFWRGFAMLVSLPAQVMAGRAIGPEENGQVAFVVSLVWPAALLMSLNGNADLTRRYHGSSPEDQLRLVHTSFLMRATIWTAASVIGGGLWIAAGYPVLVALIWMALLWAAGQDYTWVCQARESLEKAYQFLALQGVVTLLLVVFLIRSFPQADTCLAILAVGGLVSQLAAWRWLGLLGGQRIIGSLPLAKILFRSQLLLFATALCSWTYNGLEMVYLKKLLGDHETGLYRSALSSVAPLQTLLLVTSVTTFPKILQAFSEGNPRRLLFRILLGGAVLLPVLCTVTWLLGPWAFRLVWGPSYWPAAEIFVVLSWTKFLVGFTLILANFSWARRRDWQVLAVTVTASLAAVSFYPFFIGKFGCMGAAGTVLALEIGICIAITILAFKTVSSPAPCDPPSPQLS